MSDEYTATLTVHGDDGDPHKAVVDRHDDRDVAMRRCENLARFGREQRVPFTIVLTENGNAVQEWSHKL